MLKAALVSFLALLLFMPCAHTAFPVFREPALFGVSAAAAIPRLTRKSWRRGVFQRSFENWAMKGNGLWGWLVKADNELNLALFSQISSEYKSPIKVGRENQLFQETYIAPFNRQELPEESAVELRVLKLKQLQERLAGLQIPLLIFVSSNVMEVYPELVPASYTDPSRLSRKSSYERMTPLLNQHGLVYVDGHELMLRMRGQYGFRLFHPTGSHWNSIAVCETTRLVLDRMEQLLSAEIGGFSCGNYQFHFPPVPPDQDLLEIANLLYPERLYKPAPYVQTQAQMAGGEVRPRVLFVGTSFLLLTLGMLEQLNLVGPSDMYFYYQQRRNPKTGRMERLRRRSIDWAGFAGRYDMVILERNEASIEGMGFEFVDDALKRLPHAGG